MSYAVKVENLTVKFGDFKAVDNVSFAVEKGEIFGFLGANGAGKTTTIRVLCGLLTPSSGRVRVAGRDPEEGLEGVKEKVGYMSQRFTLYQDMTVKENLQFAASLRKIPQGIFKKREKELLEMVKFEASQDTLVQNLPGGLKQEVSLVGALLHDPEVVFLDEPTAGVTPTARARFWALIHRIVERGKTVFVTTHYMDEAEQCGRIALMRDGKLVALDTPGRLKKSVFPEPLYELTAKRGGERWVEQLRQSGAVLSLKPYGLRYHAVVGNQAAWRRALADLPNLSAKSIEPSLEDVFIRVVEGLKA